MIMGPISFGVIHEAGGVHDIRRVTLLCAFPA